MVTTVGTESAAVDLLRNLISLDYDAIDAYRAAIERLEDEESRRTLTSFMHDHERHTRELGKVLTELGENPPTGGDVKGLLTKGKVLVAGMAGDEEILRAMKSNEDDTNTAYQRSLEHEDLTPQARDALERGFADERRHRSWLEERLAQF